MNLNRTFSIGVIVAITAFTGILSAGETGKGGKPDEFRFLGGNPEDGQTAFTTLNCIECHSVKNVVVQKPPHERWIALELGFETRFVKRYEDLILAITNPRHVMNEQYRAILKEAEIRGGLEPLMPDMTRDMSARQLIDLTAFLHQVYERELPAYGSSAED